MGEPLLFEISVPGRAGFRFPEADVPLEKLPEAFLRRELPMPELSEVDVVRHFTRLSQLNHSIDTGFYPLGSCTMKYNPKVNEEVVRLPGFASTHPLQPVETVQANLVVMYELQEWLKEIGGFAGVTLQPAAGAQGEFVELEPDLEGLLHVSGLTDRKDVSPEELVKVGDKVKVKVLRVDAEERKIGLSLRAIGESLRDPSTEDDAGHARKRRRRDGEGEEEE